METTPYQVGLFHGLEDCDWQHLEKLTVDFDDFMAGGNMWKQFHGLVDLTVDEIPDGPQFWSRLLEVITPQTHPELQTFQCHREHGVNWEPMVLPEEVMKALLQWPSLTRYPGYHHHPNWTWNVTRNTKLVELAAHSMDISISKDDDWN